jgi:hypothetical protein
MAVKFYGNESETFAVTKKGVYLVQSVDTDKVEQFSKLPNNVEELDPAICKDIELPNYIL